MIPDWSLATFLVLGSIALSLASTFGLMFLQSFVADDRSYGALREWLLQRGARRRYARIMMALQNWVDAEHRLGPPVLISEKAFRFCLVLALLYPFLAVVIGWGLGGPATMAGQSVLTEGPLDPLPRFGQALVVLSLLLPVGGWIGFVFFRRHAISIFLARWLRRGLGNPTSSASQRLISTAADTLVVVFAGAFAFAFAVSVTFALSGTFAGGFALAVSSAGAVIVAGFGAFAFAGGFALVIVGTDVEALLVILLLLLPWLNASCDSLSLFFSRKLLTCPH